MGENHFKNSRKHSNLFGAGLVALGMMTILCVCGITKDSATILNGKNVSQAQAASIASVSNQRKGACDKASQTAGADAKASGTSSDAEVRILRSEQLAIQVRNRAAEAAQAAAEQAAAEQAVAEQAASDAQSQKSSTPSTTKKPKKSTTTRSQPAETQTSATSYKTPIAYGNNASAAQGIIAITNQYRQEVGLGGLSENSTLDAIALDRANDMIQNGYFDHYKNGEAMAYVLGDEYGVYVRGENIVRFSNGYSADYNGTSTTDPGTVASVLWRNSPGHYANMVKSDYSKIGVSMVQAPDGIWYGVQIFI